MASAIILATYLRAWLLDLPTSVALHSALYPALRLFIRHTARWIQPDASLQLKELAAKVLDCNPELSNRKFVSNQLEVNKAGNQVLWTESCFACVHAADVTVRAAADAVRV